MYRSDFLNRSHYNRPDSFVSQSYPNLGIPDDFVVVDTETTGLGNDDEVVELSVLDSDANELYHSFFKPKKQIHPAASEKTGIYNRDLVNCPRFIDEWNKIENAINGRRIAGHNIGFDKRLIQQTLEMQSGVSYEVYCNRLFDEKIDSLRMIRELHLIEGSKALGNICAFIGVPQEPNHRSSHDCLGVLYVLQYMENTLELRKSRGMPNIVTNTIDKNSQFGLQ